LHSPGASWPHPSTARDQIGGAGWAAPRLGDDLRRLEWRLLDVGVPLPLELLDQVAELANGKCLLRVIDQRTPPRRRTVQLTNDGHKAYLEAVEGAFGGDVDYAMLVYGPSSELAKGRYSPAECISARKGSKATPIRLISARPMPSGKI
jgi:hypothetical protein